MRRNVTTSCALGVVLAVALVSGCGDKDKGTGKGQPSAKTKGGHEAEHGHEGPHGGDLVELGDGQYHAELVHDDPTNTVTVYVLDSAAKKATPIAAEDITINMTIDGRPQQFKLAAKPLDGEEGKSSRFESTDEGLMKALDIEEAAGRLNAMIEGKSYSGAIEHHEHGDHAHDGK